MVATQVRIGSQVSIVPINEAHIPALVQLSEQLQLQSWSQRHWLEALAVGYPGWVMVSKNIIFAFLISQLQDIISELLLVGIHPEFQGKGYGRQLLQIWQQHAQQQGISELQLEVKVSNQSAQKLYERFGFQRVGRRKGYYPTGYGAREDALLYTKNLF